MVGVVFVGLLLVVVRFEWGYVCVVLVLVVVVVVVGWMFCGCVEFDDV